MLAHSNRHFHVANANTTSESWELIYDVHRGGSSFLVVSFFRACSIASRIKTSDLAKVSSELPRPKGERILAEGCKTGQTRDLGCFLQDFSYAPNGSTPAKKSLMVSRIDDVRSDTGAKVERKRNRTM